MRSPSRSILSHTIVRGLRSANQAGWTLTGGVTFYQSEVNLTNVVFEDSQSEDALNIVGTSFIMDSVEFRNTLSDAFDGDFVEGRISNSSFINPGNDGIDVSGSKIQLDTVRVYAAGDKAFSAGELSIARGTNLTIT